MENNNGKCEASVKLETALKKGELKYYLVSRPEYRLSTYYDPGFDMMNDYMSLLRALYGYGSDHPEFGQTVKNTVLEILNEGKPGGVYSVFQIIRLQLLIGNTSRLDFVTDEVLDALRRSISANKEFYENTKKYEGAYYDNGMYGALCDESEKIFGHTGKRII